MKKKNLVKAMIVSFLISATAFGFASCGGKNSSSDKDEIWNMETVYAKAQELGFSGTLEEFKELIKGNDGQTPHIGENGNWFIGSEDTGVKAKGENGQNGITPHIGEDGYWYVGNQKTDIKAKGDKGETGNGILKVEFNAKGNLVIYYTNGEQIELTMPEKKPHLHVYGDWEFIKEPTETEAGEAKKVCVECGEGEKRVVPKLTDSKVWECEVLAPTDSTPATKVYTSEYGTFKIQAAPNANRTYSAFKLQINNGHIVGYNSVLQFNDQGIAVVLPPLDTKNKNQRLIKTETGTSWESGTEYSYKKEQYTDLEGIYEVVKDPVTGAYKVKVYGFKRTVEIVHDVYYDGSGWGEGTPYTYKLETFETDEKGNLIKDPTKVKEYDVNMSEMNGVMVKTTGSAVYVLNPFVDKAGEQKLKRTTWDNAVAMNLSLDGQENNIFIADQDIYMNVTFKDLAGNVLKAEECEGKKNVRVYNQEGVCISGYILAGKNLVKTDGFDGNYTSGSDILTLNGSSEATLNGVKGHYEKLADNKIGAYVGGSYYEITITENTFTKVKPEVTVSFVSKIQAVDAVNVNKNAAYTLPVPESADYIFKGWFTDAECTTAVSDPFVPTENVTVYAKWANKITVNLVYVKEGDETILVLAEGDKFGDYLPKYTVDEAKGKKFVGWYLDAEFKQAVPENAVVDNGAMNAKLYAKWENLPVYYGSYKGYEVYGKHFNSKTAVEFRIDENNNITGGYAGVVQDYDSSTHKLTWKSDKGLKYMYVNESLGLLVCDGKGNENLETAYYVFSKDPNFKIEKTYAVEIAETGTKSRGYYARFIKAAGTTKEIFVCRNTIYDTFTATDINGNPLNTDTVAASKTVIVKSGETTIIAVSATGTDFNTTSDTVDLDTYYGKYTTADGKEVVLDGVGNLTYDGKSGTYTLANETNLFDVYLNNNTEYYEMQLNGAKCTMTKAEVTITFDSKKVPVPALKANKNVVCTLPVPEKVDGFVFDGWYKDAGFTAKVEENFVPTTNITLYANWKEAVLVKVDAQNGTSVQEIQAVINEALIIDEPAKEGFAFAGWYTTSDYATEWVNGSVVTGNITLYAKWKTPSIYANKTYGVAKVTTSNGYLSATTEVNFDIDGIGVAKPPMDTKNTNQRLVIEETSEDYEGVYTKKKEKYNDIEGIYELVKGPVTGTYKVKVYGFKSTVEVINDQYCYEGQMGEGTPYTYKLETFETDEKGNLVKDPAKVKEYDAALDEKNGLITFVIGNYVYLFSPFENQVVKANIKSSSFDNAITFSYTYGGNTYNVFFENNVPFLNVTFTDDAGQDITADKCAKAPALNVKNAEGTIIAQYANGKKVIK